MNRGIRWLLTVVLLLSLWELGTILFSPPVYLLPSPVRVLAEFWEDWRGLGSHALVTAVEALAGLLVALVIGLLAGVVFTLWSPLRQSLYPVAVGAQTIPIIAIAPLFAIWFGNGLPAKIAMAATICVFPVIVGATDGLRRVLAEQLELAELYGAGKVRTLWLVRIPSAVPQILTATKVAAALSVIGAIVAEYTGASSGLGYVIIQSTYRLQTPRLFAGVVLSALTGLALVGIVNLVSTTVLQRFQLEKSG